jgi:hypothetical protein
MPDGRLIRTGGRVNRTGSAMVQTSLGTVRLVNRFRYITAVPVENRCPKRGPDVD